MSTQLRLVEAPAAQSSRTGRTPGTRKSTSKVAPARRGSRRAVNWGDWRLDARTRSVGRAGVARAREALEAAAAAEELSQAS